MKNTTGFTLLELMITIAVVAILAAIAIATYPDYAIRSKVVEGVNAAGAAKNGVAEYYAINESFPATNADAGLSAPTDYGTQIIHSLEISDGGVVTISFNEIGGSTMPGQTLVYVPFPIGAGQITWNCDAAAGIGSLPDKYAPANCRGSD